MEANLQMGKVIQDSKVFELPAIEDKLVYTGEKQSRKEAEDARKLAKEYRSILSVEGVDLQIDAPDLAMAKSLGVDWTEKLL